MARSRGGARKVRVSQRADANPVRNRDRRPERKSNVVNLPLTHHSIFFQVPLLARIVIIRVLYKSDARLENRFTAHQNVSTFSMLHVSLPRLAALLKVRNSALATFGTAFLLSACATQNTPVAPSSYTAAPTNAAPANAAATWTEQAPAPEDAVITAGYTRIAEVYYKQPELKTVALNGLRRLAEIDPVLTFDIAGGFLYIRRDGEVRGRFDVPATGDNPEAWASLVSQSIAHSRKISPAVAQKDRETVLTHLFDGFTQGLDGYSRYSSSRDSVRERSLREGFGGVGMAFERADGGYRITRVFKDAPADYSGLRVGDLIVSIDGTGVEAMNAEQIRDRLRGPIRSFVILSILRNGERIDDVSILRERVIANTVEARVEDGIGIITIDRFNAATALNVLTAVTHMITSLDGDLKGLVLDLRSNPGGLLEQAVGVADLFVTRGDIIRTAGRHPDSFQQFSADADDILNGLPVIVLIDGGSASAAEVVAAAVQENGRGLVIGSASYGKGSVQTVSRLPNDGELFVTWSEIFTPAGHSLNRAGVAPNICTVHELADGDDIDWGNALHKAKSSVDLWAPADTNTERYEQVAENLRKNCPPRRNRSGADIDLAKELINRPARYFELSAASVIAARTGHNDTRQQTASW